MFRSRISLWSKLEDSSIYPLSFSETETIDVHRDRTIVKIDFGCHSFEEFNYQSYLEWRVSLIRRYFN